jgi:phage gp46-like protein
MTDYTIRVTEDGRVRITEREDIVRITERRAAAPVIAAVPIVTALTDVRTTWDAALLQGDWVFAPPDLASGRDLETAATISLFTDRLAHVDDRLPDPTEDDRRGWWADWDHEGGPIGSRLWLLSREKETEDVRLRAEEYCREALQWMLDDDVADSIEVSAAWAPGAPGRLDVDVAIARDRAVLLRRHFSWAWRQLYQHTALQSEGGD